MIDWVGLDRESLLREVISEYEKEIAVERSRIESLRLRKTATELAAEEMETKGLAKEAQHARLVAHELGDRIAAIQKQIDSMSQILAHFREELSAVEPRHR